MIITHFHLGYKYIYADFYSVILLFTNHYKRISFAVLIVFLILTV